MDGCAYELVDVGGQTHEMKTWANELEKDIAGVVFLVSLAEFMRRNKDGLWANMWASQGGAGGAKVGAQGAGGEVNGLPPDQKPNRLLDGLLMLNDVLRASPRLQTIPMVVMLNKSDLFDDRVNGGEHGFTHYFPGAPDHADRDPAVARDWLRGKIAMPAAKGGLVQAPHAKLTSFASCATDRSQAADMVQAIFNAVLFQSMADNFGLQMDQ